MTMQHERGVLMKPKHRRSWKVNLNNIWLVWMAEDNINKQQSSTDYLNDTDRFIYHANEGPLLKHQMLLYHPGGE
jgi:hypothetical protein